MSRPSPVRIIVLATLISMGSLIGVSAPAAAFTPADAKAPMTVTLVRGDDKDCGVNCPEWLAMTGKIGFETVGRLKVALARLGSRRVPVLVDSPGGESKAGLVLGEMIRAHRLDTVVAGTTLTSCGPADHACLDRLRVGVHPGSLTFGVAACASACVFVLAGGVERSVPPGGYVGVHQAKQVQTFHRVINTFRVLKRMVGGRPVEVSRTLVASRALPAKVVVSAAPETLYSTFDRFLLRMGIDESIMPLIRATPPTGIHWMTESELASTHVATSSTSAPVLLGREAPSAIVALPPAAPVIAALTLDDGRRWTGTATWRLDLTAARAPKLVVDVAIPEKHLTATMSLAKSAPSSDTAAFSSAIRLGSEAEPPIAEMRPPQLCDTATCVEAMSPDPTFDGRRFGSYSFDVPYSGPYSGGDALLSGLRDRLWLDLPVRTVDGWGTVTISLTGAGSLPIATWEHLCCGAAILGPLPRPAPDPALPVPPKPVPPGASPPQIAVATAPPPASAWHAVDDRAVFDFHVPPIDHLVDGTTLFSWVFLAPNPSGPAGTPVLLATTDIDASRLSMSIEVAPALPVSGGRLLFTFHPLIEDPFVFGPITAFSVSTELSATGDPLFLPIWFRRIPDGSGYGLAADVPLTGEMPKRIEVEFDDARKRRVTLVIPIDDAVAAVLQTAARKSAAGGS